MTEVDRTGVEAGVEHVTFRPNGRRSDLFE